MPDEQSRRLRKRLSKPFNKLNFDEQFDRKALLESEIAEKKRKNKEEGRKPPKKGARKKKKKSTFDRLISGDIGAPKEK